MPSTSSRTPDKHPPLGMHDGSALEPANQASVGCKDEQRQEGEERKKDEEKTGALQEEKKCPQSVNEQVAVNRRAMQKIAFDHLASIRKEEEHQMAQLEENRHVQNVEREKAVASENMKQEDEKITAMVENRNYNVYLREEKSQRDLQEKKSRRAWVVEKDETLEAKKKKLEEELWTLKEPTQRRDVPQCPRKLSEASAPWKDTKQGREDMGAEEPEARPVKEEKKWMQSVNEQVAKNRQERQQIAFEYLAAIRKEEEEDMAQLEQERNARDTHKQNAVEAVKKKEEEDRKAATANNRDYNFYLREEKSQRDLLEKKTRRAWVVEKDQAVEAERKREEEHKQIPRRDNKEYREIITKALLLYKDQDQEDQEREQRKVEDEAKARQACEEERKRIESSLNSKHALKNREKMQQIAFDHLAAIRREEEKHVAQLERSRHARDAEKDEAEEAEKREEEEEKRAALVKNRKYNVFLREVKSQQNLQEKKTRCDWVVEMDEALEAEKKREEERRTKEKHIQWQDRKEYKEAVAKAFLPFKDKRRQEEEREKVTREEEEKARQAREEERKRIERGLKNKEIVKKRQEMQQIAFDHLAAIRREEEKHVAQLERSRHARDAEKDEAEEAEKREEEEEKRAALVKNRKYNVFLREVKSQQEPRRTKP